MEQKRRSGEREIVGEGEREIVGEGEREIVGEWETVTRTHMSSCRHGMVPAAAAIAIAPSSPISFPSIVPIVFPARLP